MNKYLGLDVGTKTLGLSISLSGIIASPLETLRFEEIQLSSSNKLRKGNKKT